MIDEKIRALSQFLSVKPSEIEDNDSMYYECNGEEYKVLTDEEADEEVKDYIEQSVWAFNASFLSDFTGMPKEMFEAVQDKCEGANDAVIECIERAEGGIDAFVDDAVSSDGRGHFLSGYDGEEHEETVNGTTYYIYRTN